MSKRYCIWCGEDVNHEDSGEYCKDGMFAIHYDCFFEATETAEDINKLLKMLQGLPEPTEEIISFIERMEKFQKRAAGTSQILESMGLLHRKPDPELVVGAGNNE